jgi:hypothetical protein
VIPFGCGVAALGLSVSLWLFLLGWPNPEFAPKGMAFQGPQEEYHEIKPPSSRRIPLPIPNFFARWGSG